VYAEGAVVYALVAAVEFEATDAELFLLAGDSEPRGSRRRLISTIGERDQHRASPYGVGGYIGCPAPPRIRAPIDPTIGRFADEVMLWQ
jgi:hypothetical protein